MQASELFDLSDFAHRALFKEGRPVWEALKEIRSYLDAFTLWDSDERVFIGQGTVVEPGAYIKGPCIIGANCEVRHGAYIRGNVIVGDGCVIGHATEVKNSIFLNGAKAGHFAYLGDSILGNGVNLGAGTKCANLRFDGGSIRVKQRIDSGLRKFGLIAGDGVQTGCNSVTNPGTVMGKGSVLGPCAVAKGVIAEKAIVKAAGHAILASS